MFFTSKKTQIRPTQNACWKRKAILLLKDNLVTSYTTELELIQRYLIPHSIVMNYFDITIKLKLKHFAFCGSSIETIKRTTLENTSLFKLQKNMNRKVKILIRQNDFVFYEKSSEVIKEISRKKTVKKSIQELCICCFCIDNIFFVVNNRSLISMMEIN